MIDVGGSRGVKSLAIIKHYPQLSALIVDRPQVIAEAQSYWANHPEDAVKRLRFQAGDLFTKVPMATDHKDIYLLSTVLHSFNDSMCVQVLQRVREAIAGSGARVAILEMVVPERGADLASASFDMQMFVGCQGRERTLSEWKAIIQASELLLEEVIHLRSLGSILVLCSQ
ncbi:methyltransferase [Candidatus Nitrosacidococcus sp. I8]|uniref:methyltransferase n=1 Tax=Candidatus Nitrosacidococcus sp. I8 TaxID=2942908 RepID=UPI0029D41AD4|nr:methyltransferase [Candidatus Nitrosacidococcus sp. I8]